MKKFLFISTLLIILTGCGSQRVSIVVDDVKNKVLDSIYNVETVVTQPIKDGTDYTKVGGELPDSFKIEVAFASQAPLGNWDYVHEDACEEASMILVDYFYKEKKITPDLMEKEILKLVDWETLRGYDYSIDTLQTQTTLKEYFKLNSRIVENPSVDDLKKELVAGHLIIVPAAGRMLGNPNFTGEGPLYHMLVLTGWAGDEFITNDVGTRKGKDYRYSYKVLMDAIHEWKTDANYEVYNGAKKVIVIDY